MNSKKINPKRRKANDNPYTIFFRVETNEYLLAFKDGQGVKHEMLIDKALYDEFSGFELDDKKRLNESDRHDERSELSDADLYNRAFIKPKSVFEIVYEPMQIAALHEAIAQLPEKQQRRVKLYFFDKLTYEQIAERERCTKRAVKFCIDLALQYLKEKLLSF